MPVNNSEGSSSKYVATKGVISRRNQDGTIVLMRLSDAQFFYKITGVAAAVWSELETAKSAQNLISHFTALFPEQAETLALEIPRFIADLRAKELVSEGTAEETSFRSEPFLSAALLTSFTFGGMKEFNLEQIETEVLNESVYLDVFAGSDMRLKTDIQPIQGALEKVRQLNGVTHKWDAEQLPQADSAKHAGLIAQEVAINMPELVRRDKNTGKLAVEYSKLNAYLVEAIKDLHQVIAGQEERIQKLEERLRNQSH